MNIIRKLGLGNKSQIDSRVGQLIIDNMRSARSNDDMWLDLNGNNLLDRIESFDTFNFEEPFLSQVYPYIEFIVSFVGGITDSPVKAGFLGGNQTLVIRSPNYKSLNILVELDNLKRKVKLNPNSAEMRFLNDFTRFITQLIDSIYSFDMDLQNNVPQSIAQGVAVITLISSYRGYSSGENLVDYVRNTIFTNALLIKSNSISLDEVISILNNPNINPDEQNTWELYFLNKIFARFLFEIINNSPAQTSLELSPTLKESLRICIVHKAPGSRMLDPKTRRPAYYTNAEQWYYNKFGIYPEEDIAEL